VSHTTRAFKTHDFWIRDCLVCDHRFTEIAADSQHAQTIYTDDYFSGGASAGYHDYLSDARLLRERGRRYARILQKYAPTGKILDVGAAAGFVLQGFAETGWRAAGIEPNAEMARFARENLNLQVANSTLENFADDEEFDLISMIQVVAHFFDIQEAFENARRLLSENGFLLIETWNRASLAERVFGNNWHEYSPPSVLHFFTPQTLNNFAARFGFEKVAAGRPAKWINGAHAKSLLRYKFENTALENFIRVIPDRFDFPYPAEDLFWVLYRKSG
jgi:SAM-dependent methyltransferase